jgi:hypothetical protein
MPLRSDKILPPPNRADQAQEVSTHTNHALHGHFSQPQWISETGTSVSRCHERTSGHQNRYIVSKLVAVHSAHRSAIAVAPDQGAEIGGQGFVVGEFLEAEHDVVEPAPAVGHIDRRDDTAIGDELDGRASVVDERVEIYGFAVLRVSEWGLVHRAGAGDPSYPGL